MTENIKGSIITKNGRDVEFGKMTSQYCPVCNQFKDDEGCMLYIRSSIDNSVTLECPSCAYTVHKLISEVPEALTGVTDIMGRPVA